MAGRGRRHPLRARGAKAARPGVVGLVVGGSGGRLRHPHAPPRPRGDRATRSSRRAPGWLVAGAVLVAAVGMVAIALPWRRALRLLGGDLPMGQLVARYFVGRDRQVRARRRVADPRPRRAGPPLRRPPRGRLRLGGPVARRALPGRHVRRRRRAARPAVRRRRHRPGRGRAPAARRPGRPPPAGARGARSASSSGVTRRHVDLGIPSWRRVGHPRRPLRAGLARHRRPPPGPWPERSTPAAGLVEVGAAAVLSWVVGFVLVPVPGGVGVREAAFVAAAGSLDPGIAAATAVAARALFVAVDALGARHRHPGAASRRRRPDQPEWTDDDRVGRRAPVGARATAGRRSPSWARTTRCRRRRCR